MIGLANNTVKLDNYNPDWVLAYEKEKAEIENVISGYITDIQHIGSTSVEGLIAKPIIDIAVGVDSLQLGEKCIVPLKGLGYLYKELNGVDGRRKCGTVRRQLAHFSIQSCLIYQLRTSWFCWYLITFNMFKFLNNSLVCPYFNGNMVNSDRIMGTVIRHYFYSYLK